MKRIRRKRPDYVKLSDPIDCIPAGIYKVLSMNSQGLQLWVSDKVIIGIMGDYGAFISPVPRVTGMTSRMKQDDFLNEYYLLLEELKHSSPEPSKLFTFCGIDASLTKQIENHPSFVDFNRVN